MSLDHDTQDLRDVATLGTLNPCKDTASKAAYEAAQVSF